MANRVLEIQATWDPECWNYCASKDNPADLLTRGLTCKQSDFKLTVVERTPLAVTTS